MATQPPPNGIPNTTASQQPVFIDPRILKPQPKWMLFTKSCRPGPPPRSLPHPSLTFRQAVEKANDPKRPQPKPHPVPIVAARLRGPVAAIQPTVQRPVPSRRPLRQILPAPRIPTNQPRAPIFPSSNVAVPGRQVAAPNLILNRGPVPYVLVPAFEFPAPGPRYVLLAPEAFANRPPATTIFPPPGAVPQRQVAQDLVLNRGTVPYKINVQGPMPYPPPVATTFPASRPLAHVAGSHVRSNHPTQQCRHGPQSSIAPGRVHHGQSSILPGRLLHGQSNIPPGRVLPPPAEAKNAAHRFRTSPKAHVIAQLPAPNYLTNSRPAPGKAAMIFSPRSSVFCMHKNLHNITTYAFAWSYLRAGTMQAQLTPNGDSDTMAYRQPEFVDPMVFYLLPTGPKSRKEIRPHPPSLTFKQAIAKANAVNRPEPERPPIAGWTTRLRPAVQRPVPSLRPPRHILSAPGTVAKQPHASSISPNRRSAHVPAQRKEAKTLTERTPAATSNTSQCNFPSFYPCYPRTSTPFPSANSPSSYSTPIELDGSSFLHTRTSKTAAWQKFPNPLPPRLRVEIEAPPPTEWDDLIDWSYRPPTHGRVQKKQAAALLLDKKRM